MSHIDLDRLIKRLEPPLRVGLETGASIAARMQHSSVDLSHWLRGLQDVPDIAARFSTLGIDCEALRQEVDASIADLGRGDGASLVLSQNILSVCREAWLLSSLESGRNDIRLTDILAAALDDNQLRGYIRGAAPALLRLDRNALDTARNEQKDALPSDDATSSTASPKDANEFLRLYTRDMTADAESGRLDAVIGRQQELRQVIDILMRRRQNNPILVGEPGVGKTAIVEALALGIAQGEVPEKLSSIRLLLLDLTLLQAGAGVKGEFERRLHGVVDAVKSSPEPIILFIDEAHGLIGAGGQPGQGDAANILKPALARGELRTIAATTWSEYKRHIEKDAALTRRFQVVQVAEPDNATAVQMVRGIAPGLKKHHGVRIRDEAIRAAVELTARYLPARQLPDKAISVLDTAAAAVALARQTTPGAISDLHLELRLLKQEHAWLAAEPQTDASETRLDEIVTEVTAIESEIASLQSRLESELRLSSEADRLEQIIASDDDIVALPPLSEQGVDVSNVTPLGPQSRSTASPSLALKQLEQAIIDVSGEKRLVPRVVDRDVVATIVSRWTGIPVGKLLTDQIAAVQTLDDKLKQRVLGQNHVIGRIANAMRAAKAGLADPTRPPGVFLLVGMSGTGKTETALSVADILYGGSQHLTTINMSEFKEEHKISMLLGSPPGYVGYGEGGVLTEAVRRRPYGVLLLDEIDKAHPGVQEIFYQVFDKGTLRDGEGRDIDFRNTTIFMTANTGSELLATLSGDPDTMPEGEALEALLVPELQKHFKPAFLGRTTILPFMPLDKQSLLGIVDIHLARIAKRITTTYGAQLSVQQQARDALCSRAQLSEMGARAIEVMIMRDLMPVLSSQLLETLTTASKIRNIEIRHDGQVFTIHVDAINAAQESVDAPTAGAPDDVAPARKRARGGARRRADVP